MIKTIRAHYTGSVFEPLDKIDLKDGIDVTLSIITEDPEKSDDLWAVLDKYTGIIKGPSDWSSEHDHYIHGTPKKGDLNKE
ncbi:antitoxin family protein [Methanospirillum hungatei]|uniref:antitoxin family protein n=1 Tax=Methanospirillum hungatei TaxID=2203 RepID=UPI0026EC70B8|nr:antitoxin family protein [Methanospirillum hungatei]MCA1916402.1 antitoxin family protein [Methanospirillum hungatei]